MNYEVYWTKTAFAQINQLWLRGVDPERVMDAYDDVNRILSESPEDWGESRGTLRERVWFHAPLRIAFRVDIERQEVVVVDVRWIGH
jgi:hypothetical protein